MKKLILIVACFVGLNSFAQQFTEVSPLSNADPSYASERDTFNLQFSFPCTAFTGEYGVESDGNYIYVAQWLGDSIVKYDNLGNIIEMFTIPGVERVRDMAYDGQYYYGGNNNDYFYVLDLDNKVLVNTIQTSFNVRGMAYDPVEDVLWTNSNWEPEFHKLDMQGNILDSWVAGGVTMHAICGLAIDNVTYGGPSLWGFSQDSTGVMIVKYDIATQSQTGNMIDMSAISLDGFGIAGGLFISDMALKSQVILGGSIQNDVVFAFDLAYANQMVVDIEDNDFIRSFDIYPVPASNNININIDIDDMVGAECNIYNQSGQLVYTTPVEASNSINLNVDLSEFNSGTYYVQLTSKVGYSLTKKFIKLD